MFFDLHCHPSFKTFLGNRQESKRKDCWTMLDFEVDLKILDSQGSLQQYKKGGATLLVCTLYALENAFSKSGLIKLAAGLSPHVEKRFIQEIQRGQWGYHEMMQDDYHHLLASRNISSHKSFKVLNSITQYQPHSGKLQVILAAEGGHNFYHNQQLPGPTPKILDHLRFYKMPQNPRLFYITLTHLQQSEFCTHAYGMKLIKNQAFIPRGKSLRPLGRAFIREALSNIHGPPIYIDVKHMSLKSRMSFYHLRNQEFPGIPVIASHVGVTGVSYRHKPLKKVQTNLKNRCVEAFYYRSKGLVDTYFNPWSINLYDEDIREIMTSKGLIGLSLDQRILGCGNVSRENFSLDEFNQPEFHPVKKPAYHRLPDGHHNTSKKRREWQIRHFCNNWVHIIKIGHGILGEEAWNHVCVGSDFDGLIDPIDAFKTAAHYTNFFQEMVEWLPPMAQAAGIPLPAQQVQSKVRGLIFNNALSFLQKHFV